MAKITAAEYAAAIRAHCLECSGGSRKLVERCAVRGCRLFPYRCQMAEARAVRPSGGREWDTMNDGAEQMTFQGFLNNADCGGMA